MLFLLILGFLLMAALQVPGLLRRRQRGELLAFGVLWAMGFVLSLSLVERWPVPNPNRLVTVLFDPVSRWLGIQ